MDGQRSRPHFILRRKQRSPNCSAAKCSADVENDVSIDFVTTAEVVLLRRFHADALAVLIDDADAAFGADGRTDRLAIGYKSGIPGFPQFLRKNLSQFHLGIKWCFCLQKTEPVTNPVNVDIHADCRFVECNGDNQVGCLSSNARRMASRPVKPWGLNLTTVRGSRARESGMADTAASACRAKETATGSDDVV